MENGADVNAQNSVKGIVMYQENIIAAAIFVLNWNILSGFVRTMVNRTLLNVRCSLIVTA